LERIVPAAGDEIGTRSYDLARVRELLDTAYRIDGMSDPLVDWKRESAVAMLGMNYVTLMHALGESLLESSPAEAAAYLYNACALLSFHRRREQAQAICAAWREKDPESALLHRAQALVGALEAGE